MRLWLRWPTLVAILALILNVDLVIMPVLTALGVCGWHLALAGAAAGTGEFGIWYWYSKWLTRNLKKSDAGQRLAREFRYEGMLRQVQESYWRVADTLGDLRDWLVDHVQEHGDLNTPAKQKFLDTAVGVLKSSPRWMAYPLMFGLGCFPLGWTAAIAIHRLRPVPGALALFLIGNNLKVVGLGFFYLWLPGWAKVGIWLGLGLAVAWRIRVWRRRRPAV